MRVAVNGLEALDVVRRRPFDLALVDIWMSGLNGIGLPDQLQVVAPEMPAMIVTCQPAYKTAVQALRRGACDYVEKPFSLNDLRKAQRRALDRSRPPWTRTWRRPLRKHKP